MNALQELLRKFKGKRIVVLGDFVADRVVTVTVESEHQVVKIQGSSRLNDDSILVYEKDGAGKDVRTWRIKQQNGRFEAFERSMF